MKLTNEIIKVINFIENHNLVNIACDDIEGNQLEWYLLFEFDCPKCEAYDYKEGYCIAYENDDWICKPMIEISEKLASLEDKIINEFDFVEDAFASEQICNAMIVNMVGYDENL